MATQAIERAEVLKGLAAKDESKPPEEPKATKAKTTGVKSLPPLGFDLLSLGDEEAPKSAPAAGEANAVSHKHS